MWGVDDVSVTFGPPAEARRPRGRAVQALRSVTTDVAPGTVRAVVGGDGAGKTTLLDVLVGRVLPGQGDVVVPDRRQIGYMPSTSGVWRELSVDENVDFVARAYGVGSADLARRRTELLGRAGLSQVGDRLAGQLSGGMRQKLGFCLAVLHAPRLLVLDEPSTGVDPVSRGELWQMIAEAAAGGTAVCVATTYLDEAERASQVLVLDEGCTLFSGEPSTIAEAVPGRVTSVEGATAAVADARSWRRGHALRTWSPEEAQLRQDAQVVVPDLEDAVIALTLARRAVLPHDAVGGGLAAEVRPADGAPPTGSTEPVATVAASRRARTEEPRAEVASASAAPLIEVAGAVRRFGAFTALAGADVTVAAGEVVGLLGANGAGKTTLIRLLLGLEAADEGVLKIFGEDPSRATRSRLGYMPQGLGLYEELSVRANVDFVARVFAVADPRPLPQALREVAEEPVARIGLGLQRRLAFHCALLHSPELLVLDEPTSGVDPLARARLWDTIHAQAERGTGVLVTTHYMQEAQQCDRLVLLSHGRVVGAGRERDIVAGETSVVVSGAPWPRLFAALTGAGLAVSLAGTQVRVAGTAEAEVAAVLGAAGLADAQLRSVPATLEERMAALDGADAGPRQPGSGRG